MLFEGFRKNDAEGVRESSASPEFNFIRSKFRIMALAAFIGLSALSCAENGVSEYTDDAKGAEDLEERLLKLTDYTFTDSSLIAHFEATGQKLNVSVYFDDQYQSESTINPDGLFRIENLSASVQKVSVALGEETVEMVREGVDPLLGS
jgi:hypothetical protein